MLPEYLPIRVVEPFARGPTHLARSHFQHLGLYSCTCYSISHFKLKGEPKASEEPGSIGCIMIAPIIFVQHLGRKKGIHGSAKG